MSDMTETCPIEEMKEGNKHLAKHAGTTSLKHNSV